MNFAENKRKTLKKGPQAFALGVSSLYFRHIHQLKQP
jgi:hypothetical protein